MSEVFGLEVQDFPEGYTPLESVAVTKALDETGEVSLVIRVTRDLTTWEAAGMLGVAHDLFRRDAAAAMESEEEDDEP